MTPVRGRVILIGAGPGAPGLMTVAAMEALRGADIVLYDRLAGPAFRRYLRPTTELVDVGKQPGRQQSDQDDICERLVREARSGRVVARVKGGNPFVFGRGFEEVRACAEAGIEVHVVPGVTAAIAAPTAAGIPLTHRGLTPLFTVVSGHEDPDKGRHGVDWEALGRLDGAIVVLMGVGTVRDYTARLIAGGRDPGTPVAAVERATADSQRVLRTTLLEAGEVFERKGLVSPAVVVIGDVAALPDALPIEVGDLLAPEVRAAGSISRRLAGWRIAVPRSSERESVLSLLLRVEGADPVDVPVVSFGPPGEPDPLRATLRAVRERDVAAIHFGSAAAVDRFVEALFDEGMDVRDLAGIGLGAQEPQVLHSLRRRGLDAHMQDPSALSETSADGAVVVAHLEGEGDALAGELAEAGGRDVVEMVEVGRRLDPDPAPRPDDAGLARLDAVAFASSRTVTAWSDLGLPVPPVVACIGPRTAEAAARAGLEVDVVPASATLPGFVEALAEHASGRAVP